MMEMKKILALGVIFLFIGVTIAPSINLSVVKASNDNDLVEVTTQACGIKGYGNTTVKLTREQYQNLEQYLVDFRARLNQTTTREEAVPIFKEAVVELDKYGLLPKGMSVKKAQKFVIGCYQDEKVFSKLHQYLFRSSIPTNDIQNSFCFVACHTKNYSIVMNLVWALAWMLGFFIASLAFIFNSYFFLNLFTIIIEPLVLYAYFKPFSPISIIGISSEASFFTLGLQGVKSDTTYLKGIYGFTGLHIILNFQHENSLYLGSALLVE